MAAPFSSLLGLLMTIPGVSRRTAEVILAEIGPDMGRFPTAAQLASWAGVCPGNNESAGKHGSGRTRKGSKWLRVALVEAAHAAARTKNSYLAAQYARLRGRRGPKKAALAVAHSILVIAWHLFSRASPTPTWAPTPSSSASPIRPTGTGWCASSSAWVTRSPWSQQPPDRIPGAAWSAPQGNFT